MLSEKNGRWGKAIEVPGTAALNVGGYATVTSVSCASAGNCVGCGDSDASPASTCGTCPGFVAGLNHGVWFKAETVRF